jgi:hypothetical protein
MTADDKRLRRFVDRPDDFLNDLTIWCRGECQRGEPVSTDDLARLFLGLSRARKDGEQVLASFAAAAVQRLVSQR